MMKPKVVAVVGPTASGKTSLSILIAKHFNGEVISCDSRQVYKNLDIGTAKVTNEEMNGVPHHLIDVADVEKTFTAADFKQNAEAAINSIIDNKKVPIVAGGTFFYLDQLRGKGIGPAVPKNEQLRAMLEVKSAEQLYENLLEVDPERATTIDRHNKRRLIRSLEITEALGRVPKAIKVESSYDWLIIGIKSEKETLMKRYRFRVQHWLESGIVEETKWLMDQVSPERFEEFGFEYTVTRDYIEQKISLEDLKTQYVQKNWQYAKRQLTWLKRDENIEWFSTDDSHKIKARVASFLSR